MYELRIETNFWLEFFSVFNLKLTSNRRNWNCFNQRSCMRETNNGNSGCMRTNHLFTQWKLSLSVRHHLTFIFIRIFKQNQTWHREKQKRNKWKEGNDIIQPAVHAKHENVIPFFSLHEDRRATKKQENV